MSFTDSIFEYKQNIYYQISKPYQDQEFQNRYTLLIDDGGTCAISMISRDGDFRLISDGIVNMLTQQPLSIDPTRLTLEPLSLTFTAHQGKVVVAPLLEAAAGPKQEKNRDERYTREGLQWHHIIPNKAGGLRDHNVLKLAGYNIESVRNYILLPTHESYHDTRQVHFGNHVKAYNELIRKKLNAIELKGEEKGWTKEQYLDAVRSFVQQIRHELKNSLLKLNICHRESPVSEHPESDAVIFEDLEQRLDKEDRRPGTKKPIEGLRYGDQKGQQAVADNSRQVESGSKKSMDLAMQARCTNFKSLIQETHLESSYNSSNPSNPIPENGDASASIGGVGLKTGIIPGIKDSTAHIIENEHLFFIPANDGQSPFTEKHLKQIIRELASGIYYHDVKPIFSLHFNEDGTLFPVLPPQYEKTLVGHVMGMLDYMMKGFLNGGVFDEEYILGWLKNPTVDSSKDINNTIDFEKYIAEHLGENESYIPFRLMLSNYGISQESEEDYVKYTSSFRIIADANIGKSDSGYLIGNDFHVEYTIEGSPDYDQFLKQHRQEKGGFPDEHQKLVKAHEQMARQIERLMPKLPICREYFNLLGVIQFFANYYSTMKEINKVPLIQMEKSERYDFPAKLPPLPISQAKVVQVEVGFPEVLEKLTKSEIDDLNNATRQAILAGSDGVVSFDSLPRNTKRSCYKAFVAVLKENMTEEPLPAALHPRVVGPIVKKIYDGALAAIVSSCITANKDLKSDLAKHDEARKSLLEQEKDYKNELEKVKNIKLLEVEKNAKQDKELVEAQIKEQIEAFNKRKKWDRGLVIDHQAISKLRLESENRIKTILKENRRIIIEKISEEIHLADKQILSRRLALRDQEKQIRERMESLVNIMKNRELLVDFKTPYPIPIKRFQLLSGSSDSNDQFRQYRIMGGCGLSPHVSEPIEIPNHQGLLIQGWTKLANTDTEQLHPISFNGQNYQVFKMKCADYETAFNEGYIWLERDYNFANGKYKTQEFSILTDAIFNYQLSELRAMLKKTQFKDVINDRDQFNQSLAHYAASLTDTAYLSELQRAGCELGALDDQGQSIAHVAALTNNVTMLSFLIKNHPRTITAISKNGYTVFHVAAQHGATEVIKALTLTITNKALLANLINCRSASGVTPLFLAIFHGNETAARTIIKAEQTQVNTRNTDGSTPLHIAAAKNDLFSVTTLLSRGADASLERNDKTLPLHIACKEGYVVIAIELITSLVKAGHVSLLDAPLQSGMMPIHLASLCGSEKIVNKLIENGAKTDSKDWEGMNILMLAIRENKIRLSKSLVKNKSVNLNDTDNQGRTALYFAAEKGYISVCDYLLSEKAKTNQSDSNTGLNAIHLLAMHGARQLLEKHHATGVIKKHDLFAKDIHGKMPAHYALERGMFDTYGWLVKKTPLWGTKIDPLLEIRYAASHGYIPSIESAIKEGLTIENIDDNAVPTHQRKTLAYLAAEGGHLDLLSAVSFPEMNTLTDNRLPALHGALASRDPDIIDACIDDANIQIDEFGNTAIHLAAQRLDHDLLILLRTRGLDLGAMNNKGETALHTALQYKAEKISEFLIENMSEFPESLLHYAVRYADTKYIHKLVDKGISPNAIEVHTGFTPLLAAIDECALDRVKILIQRGADVNVRGTDCSPLELAAEKGYQEILEFLLQSGGLVEDNDGDESALNKAVKALRYQAVATLIKYGADPKKMSRNGETAINLARKKTAMKEILSGRVNSVMVTANRVRESIEKGTVSKDTMKRINLLGLDFTLPDTDLNRRPILHHLFLHGLIDDLQSIGKQELLMESALGTTTLHFAALRGEVDVLAYAEKLGVDLNQVSTHQGDSLLHHAVGSGKKEIVEWVVSRGIDLNKQNREGSTPLHYALVTDKIDIAMLLVEKRADVDTKDHNNLTPLSIACEKGYVSLVTAMLPNSKDPNATSKERGLTNLHIASLNGNVGMYNLLIKYGCNENKTDYQGNPPLHYAAEGGHLPLVEQLLTSNWAAITKVNNIGETALHWAVRGGKVPVINYLIDSIGRSQLIDAEENFTAIHHSIEPEKGFIGGLTALHLAALKGDIATIKSLVLRGANLHKKANNHSVVEYAAISGKWEALSFLIESGQFNDREIKEAVFSRAILDAPDASIVRSIMESDYGKGLTTASLLLGGMSPLKLAMFTNKPDLTQYLLEEGADPNFSGLSKTRPIAAAVETGSVENVKILIEANVDLDQRDEQGQTVLHIAVRKGNLPIVSLLLARGSSEVIADESGATPLDLALRLKHYDIAELIMGFHGVIGSHLENLSEMELKIVRKFEKINALSIQNGDSRIHRAARLGNRLLINLLAESESTHQINKQGLSPLGVCQNESVYLELIKHGTTPSEKDTVIVNELLGNAKSLAGQGR